MHGDGNHKTPLHLASLRGSLDVSRLLIEHGADIDAQDDEVGLHFQWHWQMGTASWRGSSQMTVSRSMMRSSCGALKCERYVLCLTVRFVYVALNIIHDSRGLKARVYLIVVG
jgi:hypothetical protein